MSKGILVKMLPVLSLAFLTAFSGVAAAQAQSYPIKSIRLVVPLAPGGGNDTLARYIGKHLTDSLGQSVVIDNRTGGGGLVGGEYAARSAPDGYTLIVAGSGLIVVTLTHKQLNFQRDFTPIAMIGEYAALPEEFAARIKAETEKTAKVVRESGMRLN